MSNPNYDESINKFRDLVLERFKRYCEAHRFTHLSNTQFVIENGRRYDKIVEVEDPRHPTNRRVHSFIERETGNILMPATYKAPAKHARGNIFTAPEEAFSDRYTYSIRYLK